MARWAVEEKDDAGRRTVVTVDLAQTDTIPAAIQPLLDAHGPVTGLVNNAGIVSSAPLAETPDADWQRVLTVNLTAPFILIRTLAPHMQQAGGGAIVNVASRNAYRSSTGKCGYDASKAGELADDGIRVNAVCPGVRGRRPIFSLGSEKPVHFRAARLHFPLRGTVHRLFIRPGPPRRRACLWAFEDSTILHCERRQKMMRWTLAIVMATAMAGLAQAQIVSLPVTQDTEVRKDRAGDNWNGGSRVRNWENLDAQGNGGAIVALVDFDLTGLSGDINSATLRLQSQGSYGGNSGSPRNNMVDARRLTMAWDATQATWNNASNGNGWTNNNGGLDDSVSENALHQVDAAAFNVPAMEDIDVTTSIQNALNGDPFEGFLIVLSPAEVSADRWVNFSSQESAGDQTPGVPAELEIDFVPEPTSLGLLACSALAFFRRRR